MKANPKVAIIGEYKVLSPYHKRKTYLPFTILGKEKKVKIVAGEVISLEDIPF